MNAGHFTNHVWLLDADAVVHHRIDLSPAEASVESVHVEFCGTDGKHFVAEEASKDRVLSTCLQSLQSGQPHFLEGVRGATVDADRHFACSGVVVPLVEPVRMLAVLYDLRFDDSPLTPKESEVVSCLARGDDPAEVLDIEPSTVTTHKSNAKRKLGLTGDVELGVWAARNGLA